MTTTDAAAARRHGMAVALAVIVGVASLSLAGCGGTSLPSISLFGSPGDAPQEAVSAPAATAPVAKVAVNAIVGPPDALGRQLHREFTSALEKQRVGVVQNASDGADFNLRPYILAAKERNGTKVSYVLDVTAPSGKRVNRFAGEEVVAASPSRDPWGAITPAVAEALAAKATGAFVAWLPNARIGSAAVANAPSSPRKSARKRVAAASSTQTTGSIDRGELTAVVPAVKGAPGDGGTSLTAAIQRQLRTKGVALTNRPTRSTYRVEGAVTLGAARNGKQAIQIEWVVRDPKGKKLGTVSQKNDIPAGSLDGAWGKVADQAAGAAVQGILKLLPTRGRG